MTAYRLLPEFRPDPDAALIPYRDTWGWTRRALVIGALLGVVIGLALLAAALGRAEPVPNSGQWRDFERVDSV